MKLYLYDVNTKKVLLEIDKVLSYTGERVITAQGVYGPLMEHCELSSLPDCSETLRADWRADYPSQETRLDELEYLMAGLLFGGETV